MPSGKNPTMLTCENCGTLFQKKYQGKITNRWCCRDCRDIYVAKEKIAQGNYSRSSALTYFKRFTEYKCVEYGISDYNGKSLRLQIDHIDGNNSNNVIENLRYLCPNCHTQTDTWGSKNISLEGRRRCVEAAILGNMIQKGIIPKGTKLVS
jgi:hypothetical protein